MNIEEMIQGNPQALVTNYNGVLVADSLEVADRFGKAHKNVIRDIESLINSVEANRLKIEPIAEKEYFIPDNYLDKRNREQKRYRLTRDGFSLLVMGFTGPAALHWKLLYIEAFNKMEERIKAQPDLTAMVTQITTQVIQTLLPELKKAVEPEPPKPKHIYAVVSMDGIKKTRYTITAMTRQVCGLSLRTWNGKERSISYYRATYRYHLLPLVIFSIQD